MDFNKLLEKYRALLAENRQLKERIKQLETQSDDGSGKSNNGAKAVIKSRDKADKPEEYPEEIKTRPFNKQSSPTEKIDLFMSLFKGRQDIYATRWENKKKGPSGYLQACGID